MKFDKNSLNIKPLKNNNPMPKAISRIFVGTNPANFRKTKYRITPIVIPNAVIFRVCFNPILLAVPIPTSACSPPSTKIYLNDVKNTISSNSNHDYLSSILSQSHFSILNLFTKSKGHILQQ